MLAKCFRIFFVGVTMLTITACSEFLPEVWSTHNDYATVAPRDAVESVTASLASSCEPETSPEVEKLLASGALYKIDVGTYLTVPPSPAQNRQLILVKLRNGPFRGREVWICHHNVYIKVHSF